MENQKPTVFTFFKRTVSFFALALATLCWVGCGDDDDGEFDCTTTSISFDLSVGDCSDLELDNVSGGTAPYQFSIDGTNFQPDAAFSNVATGSVTVTVRDANNCTNTEVVTITDNLSLEATADAFTITAEASGGTAPYEYSVDNTNFQTSGTFEGLMGQDYTVRVRDAHGCSANVSITSAALTSTTDARDGQTYQVVRIGDQVWFAENFNLNTNTADSTSSWYYDDDQVTNEARYGRLYTWFVAQLIAPQGWKLPSGDDYQALIDATGGGATSVNALLVGGNSGFEFELGGRRSGTFDTFGLIESTGFAWTSDEEMGKPSDGVSFAIREADDLIELGSPEKVNGLSVRFIKMD
ncbi:hypothetical protein FNH22_14595 [Fulvivirga sp. M361]|uniref:FISUMP domain-containing protein n=1 Tax=Fulvivirga sp. M361 TaxID=2594266 RepID=UPI00117A8D31|nr:FISUMP domain-containing protein [Fulvivirga sp. M361]TRX58284.1 hypothetical protein FNH22_14595 [Fulvivirga sp. M361]